MQSVIIINSEIYEKYQKYMYFFDWFEDHGDISVCIWNKFQSDVSDIDEQVPQLFDIVKNYPEWNAYIIDEPFFSADFVKSDFENSTQYSINPYERSYGSEKYDSSKDALMQLLFFLGGRGIENIDYINNYKFRAVRPTQIFLVTPRVFENLEMQKVLLKNDIENKIQEQMSNKEIILKNPDVVLLQYSDFWSRYEYPYNCRFLVYDIPGVENTRYDEYWFSLWLAVFTLALNTFNSSEIGPYKLYLLGLDISSEKLELFLNKFYLSLNNTYEEYGEEIENEVRKIKAAMEDTTCNHPVASSTVHVLFPGADFSKFYLNDKLFGLTKDKPRLDTEVWYDHKRDFDAELHKLPKAISRGKSEAVESVKRTFRVDLPLLLNQHLTRYDVEDINEELNNYEIEMLGYKTEKVTSLSSFEKDKNKAGCVIENKLPNRTSTKVYLFLLITGALSCLMGFIPFLLSSARFSTSSLFVAILISLGTVAFVTLASFLGLVILRYWFGKPLKKYSEVVRKHLDKLREDANTQSKYLSRLLVYFEKHKMIVSGKIEDRYLKHLEEMSRIQLTFEEAMEQCKSISGLCNLVLNPDYEIQGDYIQFFADKKIYLHEDIEYNMIPLNLLPNRLIPPFSFIEKLHVDEETVYESFEYGKVLSKEDPENDADKMKGEIS